MEAHGVEEIRKHVRVYIMVFAALAVLTVVTVLASYLKISAGPAVALAMAIALVKASLVGFYFMHLNSERTSIYWILAASALFLIFLLAIPVLTDVDVNEQFVPGGGEAAGG
jgi:caa(3)-type oxidase subunit IV